jgi:hypothetical protein
MFCSSRNTFVDFSWLDAVQGGHQFKGFMISDTGPNRSILYYPLGCSVVLGGSQNHRNQPFREHEVISNSTISRNTAVKGGGIDNGTHTKLSEQHRFGTTMGETVIVS